MKKVFFFLFLIISFISSGQKSDTARVNYKQRFLTNFAFSKEIIFIGNGYVFWGTDTVFFNILGIEIKSEYNHYYDHDSIWIKTPKGSHGYSRYIYVSKHLPRPKNNIGSIVDTITGRKSMQGWRFLNDDECFFPILEKVLINGQCVFSNSNIPILSSYLGISKNEAEQYLLWPTCFPPYFSEGMKRRLGWYNPILYKRICSE